MKEGDFVYSITNSCGPRRVEISYKEKGQSKMGPQRNLSDNDWAVFYYLVAYCKWNSFAPYVSHLSTYLYIKFEICCLLKKV